MSSQGYHILILGGGVAGLTTAMALSKCAPAHVRPKIDVFEVRPEPGTVGGAINLTPNALRLLDFLGVWKIIQEKQFGITVNAVEVFSLYHPRKLAESSFRGPHGQGVGKPPFKVPPDRPIFPSLAVRMSNISPCRRSASRAHPLWRPSSSPSKTTPASHYI